MALFNLGADYGGPEAAIFTLGGDNMSGAVCAVCVSLRGLLACVMHAVYVCVCVYVCMCVCVCLLLESCARIYARCQGGSSGRRRAVFCFICFESMICSLKKRLIQRRLFICFENIKFCFKVISFMHLNQKYDQICKYMSPEASIRRLFPAWGPVSGGFGRQRRRGPGPN